jgi:hypothetical protein
VRCFHNTSIDKPSVAHEAGSANFLFRSVPGLDTLFNPIEELASILTLRLTRA